MGLFYCFKGCGVRFIPRVVPHLRRGVFVHFLFYFDAPLSCVLCVWFCFLLVCSVTCSPQMFPLTSSRPRPSEVSWLPAVCLMIHVSFTVHVKSIVLLCLCLFFCSVCAASPAYVIYSQIKPKLMIAYSFLFFILQSYRVVALPDVHGFLK